MNSNMSAKRAKQIRKALKYSQSEFAELLGVSKRTVESWEQGANRINKTASKLYELLCKYPSLSKELRGDAFD